jgi:predicted GH43/DUF377 family glycosyl hydrolase
VAKCRLGVKKVGKIYHQMKDHLCDVVIHELENHGVEKIEDVTDEQTFVAMCKIKQGWSKIFKSECWRWNHTPFSRLWDEAEILRSESAGKATGLLQKAETKRKEELRMDELPVEAAPAPVETLDGTVEGLNGTSAVATTYKIAQKYMAS